MSSPIQVPVPVFLPTTLQGAELIVQTINELKTKVPSDPLEADLLSMAEMIAEDQKPGTFTRGLDVLIKTLGIRDVMNTMLIEIPEIILINMYCCLNHHLSDIVNTEVVTSVS